MKNSNTNPKEAIPKPVLINKSESLAPDIPSQLEAFEPVSKT